MRGDGEVGEGASEKRPVHSNPRHETHVVGRKALVHQLVRKITSTYVRAAGGKIERDTHTHTHIEREREREREVHPTNSRHWFRDSSASTSMSHRLPPYLVDVGLLSDVNRPNGLVFPDHPRHVSYREGRIRHLCRNRITKCTQLGLYDIRMYFQQAILDARHRYHVLGA